MCRWLAYYGNPIHPEPLLYEAENSLVAQSRRDRLAGGHPNADGFGLGWYGGQERPGLYRSVTPAWADPNLRELAQQIASPLFIGHVRAATGTPVEQSNCHPFRHGRWLFAHNGFVDRYLDGVRRELVLAIRPDLFPTLAGSTDSEVLFHLALTFGLEEDPVGALERMAGFVEEVGRRHGSEAPLQMTVAVADGERLYAVRYASGPEVNSLYVSADANTVRGMYPDNAFFQRLSDECRVVVSEPLGDLPGVWEEIPPGTAIVVQPGDDEVLPFTPRAPAPAPSS